MISRHDRLVTKFQQNWVKVPEKLIKDCQILRYFNASYKKSIVYKTKNRAYGTCGPNFVFNRGGYQIGGTSHLQEKISCYMRER